MNRDILEQFLRLHAAGRLSHAYVFAGPKGIGRHETALALAAAVNCARGGQDPAGCDCSSCVKVRSGNHPDVFMIDKLEEKTEISIDQVRFLVDRLGYCAMEARVKFAVIRDAENLSQEAANAFLKTLEEPRPATVLILTVATPDALLPTIRSRCQMVCFPVMSDSALAAVLKSRYDVPSDDAHVLAAFGYGSPGRALALGQKFLDRRRGVLDAFLGTGDTEAFIARAAGSDVEKTRDKAREALEVVLMVCRDALWIKAGVSGQIVNRDRLPEIRRFAERFTPEELSAHAQSVTDAFRRIDANQNVKVVLTAVRELL